MGTRRTAEEPAVPVPPTEPVELKTGPGPKRMPPRSANDSVAADPFNDPLLQPGQVRQTFQVPMITTDPNGYKPMLPELYQWMADHQRNIREGADTKAFEYGSTDLHIMAGAMVQMFPGIDPVEALQAAIAFYALGKVSRVLSSFKEGRPAPADSWRDLEVYAMMAQRIMEQGGWP